MAILTNPFVPRQWCTIYKNFMKSTAFAKRLPSNPRFLRIRRC